MQLGLQFGNNIAKFDCSDLRLTQNLLRPGKLGGVSNDDNAEALLLGRLTAAFEKCPYTFPAIAGSPGGIDMEAIVGTEMPLGQGVCHVIELGRDFYLTLKFFTEPLYRVNDAFIEI